MVEIKFPGEDATQKYVVIAEKMIKSEVKTKDRIEFLYDSSNEERIIISIMKNSKPLTEFSYLRKDFF